MMAQPSSNKPNPIVIKKYANRRLYNTDTSAYVTLDDLCQMIKEGEDLVVYDAKNGDDITRSVLTQIIVEQEAKGGQQLLPTAFLRQLISFYGNNMQSVVPRYLEYTMQTFTKNQSQMRDYFRSAFGGVFGNSMFGQTFEEMGKQNMAIFEQAMKMFSPFAAAGPMANAMNNPMATMNAAMSGMGASMGGAPSSPASASASATPAGEAASKDEASPISPTAPASNYSPHLRPVSTPGAAAASPAPEKAEKPAPAPQQKPQGDGSIEQMQNRLDELQKQIATLSKVDER